MARLLVFRKITVMHLIRLEPLKIIDIFRIVVEFQLQTPHDVRISLLKDVGIFSIRCGSTLILPIVIYMVDEEQRQALNTLTEQFSFFLDMRLDRCSYLRLTNCQFIHITYHITFIERDTVLQMDTSVIAVNLRHTIVIFILLQLA